MSFNRYTACLLIATILPLYTKGQDSPELPSESTLPGQIRPKRDVQLPSESSLPGEVARAAAPTRSQLPPESALPGASHTEVNVSQPVADEPLIDDASGIASPSDAIADAQADALQVIGQAPASLPWLRLNMSGHTGAIRAMAFSRDGTRLCSAGEDKTMEVWTRAALAENEPRWTHERSVRWQIQRGPLGRLYALAPGKDVMAMAGYGAVSHWGEILLVDPLTGELKIPIQDNEAGHRQPVVAMSFAASATMLASQDLSGRALLWLQDEATGGWSPRELSPSDTDRYGQEIAKRIGPPKRRAPIAFAGNSQVLLPVYDKAESGVRGDGVAVWHLAAIDAKSLSHRKLAGPHLHMVTALAASADGKRAISADSAGNLYFWDLASGRAVKRTQNMAIVSLSLSENGQLVAAGGSTSAKRNGNAAVQLWDWRSSSNPTMVEKPVPALVQAVALSPDGQWVAYSQDTSIQVGRAASLTGTAERLRGRARPVLRVAFAAKEPHYRIALGTRAAANGTIPWEQSFDLESVQLEAEPRLAEADWLRPDAGRGDWSVRGISAATGDTFWLYLRQQRAAQLPLLPELHGSPTATCWLSDPQGKPFAVAVGTNLQNNIYIFRLANTGSAALLRQFRGHEGTVRSLSISRDRRYLVSSADDATVRVWNMAGFDSDTPAVNRWGAQFEVRDGALVVSSIREDGPLYFRGIRTEDVIRFIRWREAAQDHEENDPAKMLAKLNTADSKMLVRFDYRRRDQVQPPFQMLPAWQPLVSLFVSNSREWAFWTPAGYYDASFDGHKLFGWQVNRGLSLLPEFFLAAQFQQALERPEVMARLLSAGSLDAAFRDAQQPPPAEPKNVVIDQYRLKPLVEITSPRSDQLVQNSHVQIEAKITVRDGLRLTPPKAFANGVVAGAARKIDEKEVPGGREFRYQWDARLPADPRVIVQVVASTEAAAVEAKSVIVRHQVAERTGPGRLFIVAAGINQYRDAQIQRLDYAVSNVQSVVELLRERSGPIYNSEATMLLNDRATRPMWSFVTRASAERLEREAGPDDLLLFFLSGHGVRDEESKRYYFVAADARFDDVKSRRFSDCLSFDDFAAFSNVRCRKLIVLDTCHSGAIQQPLRQQDLKAALRALQNDVVFTMTASDGSQEATEEKEKRLGRFTARLLEALAGAADEAAQGGDSNGIVTLQEAFRFVSTAVPTDSAGDTHVQHPTAGPIDLLDYAVVPLTAK